jgi:hypothetical protein
VLQSFLDQFGLANLSDWAWQTYIGGGGDATGLAAVQAQLPQTAEYKARFPAIDARTKAGLPAITPADYINYENTIRQAFNQYGLHLPTTGSNFNDLITELLTKDISANEVVTDRIGKAFSDVENAPPQVRAAAAQLWGIHGDNALASTFLDPNRSAPQLQKLSEAMQTAGYAQMYGFDITRGRAEDLAALGNTQSGINNLGKIAAMTPLFNRQAGENNNLSLANQGIGAAFNENATDQTQIEQQLQMRKSMFATGGASPQGQQGVA